MFCGLLAIFRLGSRVAETPRRIDPILGKKEQRVVGLFSAGQGEQGGKMGVREEEETEEGKPGEGVSGVTGLEGGKDDGLELVSSVELSDSLRKWVYFVFEASSILYLQCQTVFLFSICIHTGSGIAIKAQTSLCRRSKFLSKTGHLRGSLRVNPHPSVFFCSLFVLTQLKPNSLGTGLDDGSRTRAGAGKWSGVPVRDWIWTEEVCFVLGFKSASAVQ